MTFNSVGFFILFFSFLPIYYLFPKFKWIPLLVFNIYFYIMLMPQKLYIVLFTAIITYSSALIIDKLSKVKYKKFLLAATIITILSLLLYSKYFEFFTTKLLGAALKHEIIAPIGISFYSLQLISYLVDVYKGIINAEKNPFIMITYVTFFGTILSGPIDRARSLLPQLKSKIKFDIDKTFSALYPIITGLFMKVLIADRLVTFVDTVYNNPYGYKGYPLLLASMFYAFQLYADFAGYSLMAIGFSRALGIELMNNFASPYLAVNITDFWRRWHISLSTWFRDYLYIPLGGSRKGKARTHLNRILVFTVSGIWHGANWTFMIWGFLHGMYQVIHATWANSYNKISKWLQRLITFIAVDFAWVFFRANSAGDALYIMENSFRNLHPRNFIYFKNIISKRLLALDILLIVILISMDICREKKFIQKSWQKVLICLIMLVAIIIYGQATDGTFIYFKF